jgi:putative ABC transport system ATP-binding protein
MELFRELNDSGLTVVVVTHERDVGRYADGVVTLVDGRVSADQLRPVGVDS